ncbi:hypothetical protein MAPG_04521 [Magnaporthiopsis poae ATCC 64411]|uniref:WSC domain-containing protein n=1 Tax=Magnaporthiopsis poae (strain ATCC 64411 / 73-15) TaxID=644358 RepID=A0A0C4DWY6_MAGP6|nr:hypothetical protein MAPG_04521 [Magnaporthiopsis poae ATCC 64411]
MQCFTIATAVVALFAGAVVADPPTPGQTEKGLQRKPMRPIPSDATVQGCFSSGLGLKMVNQSVQYNTMGKCGKEICNVLGYKVGASYQGTQCWCGNQYPPASSLVDDKQCNIPCPGYDWDACGGPSAFTVYNTGVELYGISNAAEASSTTTTSSPTAKATQSTTQPAAVETTSAPPSSNNTSGGGNTAAIAAGVVIGVLALAAAAGGIWFVMRRRRNREIEEEHRRNAAVNAFIHGNKPGSSGGVSMTDSRMDPVMAQRRMSDGSIADNQDYSRRILRVTNA